MQSLIAIVKTDLVTCILRSHLFPREFAVELQDEETGVRITTKGFSNRLTLFSQDQWVTKTI